MTYITIPKQEEGGTRKVNSVDASTRELLIEILTVMKKIEYHLYVASDTHLNDQDV